jgi:Transposase DDE domain
MPLPTCLFARAYRCHRFKGEAAFGKDTLLKQTFYGFRVHVGVCWPGVITRFSVAPANAHELSVVPEMVEVTRGVAGDQPYHSSRNQGGVGGYGHRASDTLLLPRETQLLKGVPRWAGFATGL